MAASRGAPQAAAQPTGEKVVVTTDDLRAEIDTAGGILSRLEMLKHHEKDGKPVVLFERDANRTYMARSGLIGGDLPNHTTVFTVAPGPRTLDGKDKLEVVLTAEKNGVKRDEAGIRRAAPYLSTQLKALMGRNLFGNEAYYPIALKNDKVMQKALQVLDAQP